MFAALHGELVLHPGRDPDSASSDAYSLFVARSSAMGWLADPAEQAPGGVWGMNDAGQDPRPASKPSRVAWFQVSLTEPVPGVRPLPVQAFLSCASDVVARIGMLRLQAVQVLLPVQSLERPASASPRVGAVMNLLQDAGWFADCDPRSRAQVRITLHGGRVPYTGVAPPEILRWMQAFKQDVFSCRSFSSTDADHGLDLDPAVTYEPWLGLADHWATFRGALAEWSPDALGWLAAFLAEASCQHGAGAPLLFTASRCKASNSRAE